jgi:filamentous hemagglutinin family protein
MATGLSKLSIAALTLVIFSAIGARSTVAQVTFDGTANRNVTGPAPFHNGNYDLRAELGRRAGRNLFHSFERFSLGAGERATFSGPDQIRNVISRVTGGARSDIDGTIASTIPGADFYFINPAGIAFGPNASLDLQGSFHVSTADELRFADGTKFSAAKPAASSLTVAAPEAFGFLGSSPEPVTVDGSFLAVLPGEALSIVGGDIGVSGGALTAAAGEINLFALRGGAAPIGGKVVITGDRADIELREQSRLSTTGDGGGAIRIRGGAISVKDGTTAFADNSGPSDSQGGIEVVSDHLELHGGALVTADVVGGAGRGGAVSVRADEVEITDGSRLSADTFAEGDAGAVTIAAARAIAVSGPGSAIRAEGTSSGVGGKVTITAPRVALSDGAVISSSPSGSGDGGDIVLKVGRFTLTDGVVRTTAFGSGWAGDLTITADRLIEVIGEDGRLFTGTSVGSPGAAGDMRLEAPRVEVAGSFVSTSTAEGSPHAAGDLMIEVGTLMLTDDARVATASLDRGPAGDLTITADEGITIENSSVLSFSLLERAGSITIAARTLEVTGNSLMTTASFTPTSFAPGAAGDITIDVDRLTLTDGARIATTTLLGGASRGGTLTVTAREAVLITGRKTNGIPSGLEAASFGSGPGGRVVVTTPRLEMRDGGEIDAAARIAGDGGDVVIEAGAVLLSGGGLITARTTGEGDAGDVDLTAGRIVIEGSGSGIVSSSATTDAPVPPDRLGNAGSIAITADRLELSDRGQINSTAAREGRAGGITVLVADRLETDQGTISTDSASAGGGEIQLLVGDVIDLRDSAVTTSVAGGADPTGGNILIDPKALVIDGSTIKADARTGTGGNIEIIADNILVPEGDLEALLARGDISASGETEEVAGTIAINAPEVDLSGGLVVLQGALLDAASQLRERCGARRDIGASSFTGVGRGGLPPSPDGPLAGAYVVEEKAFAEVQHARSRRTSAAAPANVRLVSLGAPCAPLD